MCTLSIKGVNYHKFSQGATFYAPNGTNVNAVLELMVHQTFCFSVMSNCQSCHNDPNGPEEKKENQ